MAKKLFAVALGFLVAPMFTMADYGSTSVVGDDCLIRVYHINFQFPPQGGKIVQSGNELFFWKDYEPRCADSLNNLFYSPSVVKSSNGTTTVTQVGQLPRQVVGEPCMIRVYNTNFNFPPEGGQIVRIGNEMFFVRTYKPECAGAGANGRVVQTTSTAPSLASTYNPPHTQPVTQPIYVAPPTGASATANPRCY